MKICLCGSTKFMDQFEDADAALTLAGHVVYSVAIPKDTDLTPTEIDILDAVHLQKIYESDGIMIVGMQEDGSHYIGESTRREIAFASVLGKDVAFFRPGDQGIGPLQNYESLLELAALTDAQREEQELERQRRRQRAMENLGISTEADIIDIGRAQNN